MCIGEDLSRLILLGGLEPSWIWRSNSLPRSGKFLATISLNKLSVLSSPSSTPIIHKLVLWIVLYISCRLSHSLLWLGNFQVLLFCLLTDLFCYWCSLLYFSFHSLYSSASEFVWFLLIFSISVKFLILFVYCFSNFVDLSLCFLWTQRVSWKQHVWIHYQINHRSPCLGLVTGRLLWPFGGVMFPWFFIFLEVLHCCLPIWS